MRGTEPHCHECKSRYAVAITEAGTEYECCEPACTRGFTAEDDSPLGYVVDGWREAQESAWKLQAQAREAAKESCE